MVETTNVESYLRFFGESLSSIAPYTTSDWIKAQYDEMNSSMFSDNPLYRSLFTVSLLTKTKALEDLPTLTPRNAEESGLRSLRSILKLLDEVNLHIGKVINPIAPPTQSYQEEITLIMDALDEIYIAGYDFETFDLLMVDDSLEMKNITDNTDKYVSLGTILEYFAINMHSFPIVSTQESEAETLRVMYEDLVGKPPLRPSKLIQLIQSSPDVDEAFHSIMTLISIYHLTALSAILRPIPSAEFWIDLDIYELPTSVARLVTFAKTTPWEILLPRVEYLFERAFNLNISVTDLYYFYSQQTLQVPPIPHPFSVVLVEGFTEKIRNAVQNDPLLLSENLLPEAETLAQLRDGAHYQQLLPLYTSASQDRQIIVLTIELQRFATFLPTALTPIIHWFCAMILQFPYFFNGESSGIDIATRVTLKFDDPVSNIRTIERPLSYEQNNQATSYRVNYHPNNSDSVVAAVDNFRARLLTSMAQRDDERLQERLYGEEIREDIGSDISQEKLGGFNWIIDAITFVIVKVPIPGVGCVPRKIPGQRQPGKYGPGIDKQLNNHVEPYGIYAQNNNCLFAAAINPLERSGYFPRTLFHVGKPEYITRLREITQCPEGQMALPVHIQRLVNATGIRIKIYGSVPMMRGEEENCRLPVESQQHITDYVRKIEDYQSEGVRSTGNVLYLWSYNQHVTAIIGQREKKLICKLVRCTCGEWVKLIEKHRRLSGNHKPNDPRQLAKTARRQEFIAKKKILPPTAIRPPKETTRCSLDIIQFWSADFETSRLVDVVTDRHVPISASVVKHGSHEDPAQLTCFSWYGPKCAESLSCHIIHNPGVYVFYNGSNFDFMLLLEAMLLQGYNITKFGRRGTTNKIISMGGYTITGQEWAVWDLCPFLNKSLAQACKEFKVPAQLCKTDFDHSKIQSWKDLEEHKVELLEYNKYDCLSLAYLTELFIRQIYDQYKLNANDFVSTSHMFWAYFSRILSDQYRDMIKLPTLNHYQYIKRAGYGGRALPFKPKFESQQAQTILSLEKEQGGFITPEQFNNITDYCMMLDVTSLYPWALKHGSYLTGERELIIDPILCERVREKLNAGAHQKIFVECDVWCPDDIYMPMLPERALDGSLRFNLLSKTKQVYTAREIEHCIQYGYVVTYVHSYMTFSEEIIPTEDNSYGIFGPYITELFNIKQNSEKGTIKYEGAKLGQNGLYGKTNQKFENTNWHLASNPEQVTQCLKEIYKRGKVAYLTELTQQFKITETDDERMYEYVPVEPPVHYALAIQSIEEDKNQHNKPTELGVQVLSNSKHGMLGSYGSGTIGFDIVSGGLRDPDLAAYYQDTDSVVAHLRAVENAKQVCPHIFGENLGQWADELRGGKIIQCICLAAKTYIIVYISAPEKDGKCRRYWKVRCKGIPHLNCTIPAYTIEHGEEQEGNFVPLTWNLRWEESSDYHEWENTSDDLKFREYSVVKKKIITDPLRSQYREGKVDVSRGWSCITYNMFDLMLHGEIKVVAGFGGFKKRLFNKSPMNAASIIQQRTHRTIDADRWWKENNSRALIDGTLTAYPLGYDPIFILANSFD